MSSGSNSSQNGDAVTPRSKSRPKKNFIKNIKPEAFKRPSSYSCSEVEKLEVQKAVGKFKSKDEKGVTLIGYSKVPKPYWDPSRAVLLGTFSQGHGDPREPRRPGDRERPQSTAAFPLRPASSMSSVLARTCWSRGSSASLPEISDFSQGGAAAEGPPTGDHVTPEVADGSEEDASSSLSGSLGQKRAVFRAHRSYTTPLVEGPTGGELVSAANANASGSCFQNCPITESQREGDLPSDSLTRAPKGEDGVEEDMLSISGVDCNVNQVSREDGSGVELDEDTHVENGYDEASEGGVQSTSGASIDSGVKLSASLPSTACDNLSLSSQSAHTMSRESGILSDAPVASRDSSQDEFAQETLSAATTPTDTEQLKAPISERRVTVIELLREEYERSQLEKSASGPPSAEGSPAHCQRASSDTDIMRNLERSGQQAPESSLFLRPRMTQGVRRERSRLSASSSYPELSRWVEQSQRAPKLVSVVGHSTVK